MKHKLMQMPKIDVLKNIYFVGIKGVGMAPLALIAKGAGIRVKGSDLDEEFITDKYLTKQGVSVDKGFTEDFIVSFFQNVDTSSSLVVTTGAHKGFDNPQVMQAKEMNIAVVTQGQALALFMQGGILGKENCKSVAVAGSHGKTTISSLLATALSAAGYAPTYSVGTGEVFPLGAPGKFGEGEYFVAEADEYASEPVHDRVPKFLYQAPNYAIFNNIDYDHPDMFESIDEISDTFDEFAHNIQSGGVLFVNGDDKYLKEIHGRINKDIRVVTYGAGVHNDYVIKKIVVHGFGSKFCVSRHGEEFGFFELSVPGVHNAKNSLAVIAFLFEIGLDGKKIKKVLNVFEGTNRRCERVGTTANGCLVIDDYAHHPLEITTTLSAIKQAYPSKKIIAVFQPHTYSRTKSLLAGFADAFKLADHTLLLPIFRSQRDTENDTITVEEYIGAFQDKAAQYFEDFDGVVEYCRKNFDTSDCIVVTIGAGDVYKIGQSIIHA